MIEMIGGLIAMGGGAMLVASSVPLARARGPSAAELLAALPFTPAPPTDPELESLILSID